LPFPLITTPLTWTLLCLCLLFFFGCVGKTPTGVSRTDVEGLWQGTFSSVSLLGRSLSGDIDWLFDRNDFEIRFINPPEGQTVRLAGNWKLTDTKMVLTLRTSFPVGDDVGATDSLFVSILNDQMSLQTSEGSNILLLRPLAFILLNPEFFYTFLRKSRPPALTSRQFGT